MDELRTALCTNEDLLAEFCRRESISYSSATKKSFFKELKHDGDLLHYIETSMSSQDMKSFAETAHSNGYKTCLDIIKEYSASIKTDDYLDIQKLNPNDSFSTYQIAALAKKYNIVVGMQYVEREGRRYVIIKSTLENENSRQGYHDHWLVKGKTLCYYMQKENPENVKAFSFSYEPNRRIFDSIFNNASDPLDIYVFTRETDGTPYIYQGIYRSIAISEDGRAFTLGNSGISPYDSDVSDPRQAFEERFERGDSKQIIQTKKKLSCAKAPFKKDLSSPSSSKTNSKTTTYISERDYIAEARLRQKIGDLGEEAVWEYEQDKIRAALKNDPEFAESLIQTMDWVSRKPGGERYGYDIRSYDIVNGKAIPIFIEVKTTTAGNSESFYLTEHELQTARSEEINRNYYIYRVYNINSDQPMFYFMKGDPSNFCKLKPFIWLAKIY